MTLRAAAVLTLLTVASAPAAPVAGGGLDPAGDPRLLGALDTLAAREGLTREAYRVDPAGLGYRGEIPGELQLARYVLAEPLRAPALLDGLAGRLLEAAGVGGRLASLSEAADHLNRGRAISILAAAGSGGARTLEEAMVAAFAGTGKRFTGRDRERVLREAADLGPDREALLAGLLEAAVLAARERDRIVDASGLERGGLFGRGIRRTRDALARMLATRSGMRRDDRPGSGLAADGAYALPEDLVSGFPFGDLDAAGLRLAGRVDALLTAAATAAPAEDFQYRWRTPYGPVGVGGSGANRYEGEYLLVLDFGGNDLYRGPGSVSGGELGVSVVVDRGGDDGYAATDSARAGPGGALLGLAGVWDLGEGRDRYACGAWGEGFGFLGMGWIVDDGGDDRYRASALSQGAGILGIGLLADASGKDLYAMDDSLAWGDGFHSGMGQGFAGIGGVGVLLEGGGNDTYRAGPVIFPEAGTAASGDGSAVGGTGRFVQGASRGDPENAVPFPRAGGLGLLVEGGGNDRYRAGLRGQGRGERGGLGALVERGGDDLYRCRGTGQGSGTSTGIGLLIEINGNDIYWNDGSGLGRGAALGMGGVLDAAGDDDYRARGCAAGCAAAGGYGWFADLDGTNRFRSTPAGFARVEAEAAPDDPLYTVPGTAWFVHLGEALHFDAGAPRPVPPRASGRGIARGGFVDRSRR